MCQNRTHAVQQSRGGFNGIILAVPNLHHHFSRMTILTQLASDDVLDNAYE